MDTTGLLYELHGKTLLTPPSSGEEASRLRRDIRLYQKREIAALTAVSVFWDVSPCSWADTEVSEELAAPVFIVEGTHLAV
jgi:hypothetical protein